MSWLAKKDHNQSRGRRASSSRTATSEAVLLISPSAFRASSQSASSSSVAHSIYEDELDAMPDIVDDDVLLLCISALPLRSPKPVRAVVSDSSPGPSSVSSSLHGPHGGRRSPYSPLRPGGRSANASPTLGGRPPTFRAVVPAGLRTKSPSPIPGSFGDRNTRRGNINPASFANQATLLQQTRHRLLNVLPDDLNASMLRSPSGTPPRLMSHRASPATPPPTYPSPPRYSSDGVGENAEQYAMTPVASAAWNNTSLSASRFDDDPELADGEDPDNMAPEYTDDVSFLQGVRRSGHVLCLLFTVCLYALLVLYYSGASMWLNEQAHYFKVMIFTMYSLYLIESMGSATSSALWQIYTATEAHQHFHKMMDSAPWMRWTLRCYHLKPNVNPEHHKPTDRIYTHCKTISYPLQGCADETPMNFFTSHRLCKYEFKKEWRWRDVEAEQRYEGVKTDFIDENTKDTHYTLDESWGIESFHAGFVGCRPGTETPPWASWSIFAFMVTFGLSFFYRTFFASRIGSRVLVFKKVMF